MKCKITTEFCGAEDTKCRFVDGLNVKRFTYNIYIETSDHRFDTYIEIEHDLMGDYLAPSIYVNPIDVSATDLEFYEIYGDIVKTVIEHHKKICLQELER